MTPAEQQIRAALAAGLPKEYADPNGVRMFAFSRTTFDELLAELDRLREKNSELLRWKGINAPRLEAKTGLLEAAQVEAAKGAEAISTLASEREANAILTDELTRLRAEVEALKLEPWIGKCQACGHEHEAIRTKHAAIDAAKGGEHCRYPDCGCPFDAPADPTWCAKGLPHQTKGGGNG